MWFGDVVEAVVGEALGHVGLGLGLYDKGSEAALIKGTLQISDPDSPQYVSDEEKAELAAKAEKVKATAAERMQAAVNHREAMT